MVTIEYERQMRTGQVALRLGVSPQRVLQLVVAGRLRATMTPFGRVYDAEEVDALVAKRAGA